MTNAETKPLRVSILWMLIGAFAAGCFIDGIRRTILIETIAQAHAEQTPPSVQTKAPVLSMTASIANEGGMSVRIFTDPGTHCQYLVFQNGSRSAMSVIKRYNVADEPAGCSQ